MNIINYKHIIWDWNGTLLDDVSFCVEIINGLLSKRHLPQISRDYYREVFTFPVRKYYEKIGFDFFVEPWENVSTEFITTYETLRSCCSLMPGGIQTLRCVSEKGLSQSILSASKQTYLLSAIQEYHLDGIFTAINGLDNHHAASKVDIGKSFITNHDLHPSNFLLVGDTVHDAEVAAAMGVDCCLIPNGHQTQERLAACGVPVINSLINICP